MGMDTTPRPGNQEPDHPEDAPRWFLLLIVMIIAIGGAWLLWLFIGGGRTL